MVFCLFILTFYFKIGHSRLFFLYFRLFNTVNREYMNEILPMTGFEPRISGPGSDRSTN